jgi:alkylation response protein AidB-like acyl-CoA dehydrogenase
MPDRPGWYRLEGEKWFCSVADAGLFVVSARPEGAPAGTRGLALFLVPRMVDGAPNRFALRRLKYKLGTRSMATGEIELEGALGELVGPLDGGFRNLVAIVLARPQRDRRLRHHAARPGGGGALRPPPARL